MKKLFLLAVGVGMLYGSIAFAQGLDSRVSNGVVVDTGNTIGGFSVTVSTPSKTLLSASGATLTRIWRLRTFQVTGTTYMVWMSSHSTGSYGQGGGWYVAGSTGSFTTRSQGAIYGILSPAAGSGTGTIKGPFEYQAGEQP